MKEVSVEVLAIAFVVLDSVLCFIVDLLGGPRGQSLSREVNH